jgi:hypothetical protein
LQDQKELLDNTDWNTLILLGSLRYDIFKEAQTELGLKGSLAKVNSHAITTPEWYERNWAGKRGESPAILVTSNTQPFRVGELKFSHAFRTWFGPISRDAISPQRTLGCYKLNNGDGNKTVVHFVPPHLPFISSHGIELERRFNFTLKWEHFDQFLACIQSLIHFLPSLEEGMEQYGRQTGKWYEIRQCYKESLYIVLALLNEHKNLFKPPVVISSDHAELIGEDNRYGHRCREGPLIELQQTVPWFNWEI